MLENIVWFVSLLINYFQHCDKSTTVLPVPNSELSTTSIC